MTKIIDVVGDGRVLADSNAAIVRLWTKAPRDGRVLRAIRRCFPGVEEYGMGLLRLGGYSTLRLAMRDMLKAKTSSSPFVRALHLCEEETGEGMQTIIKAGLLQ